MVLLPDDAYFPGMSSTLTFGNIRRSIVDSSSNGKDIPLGIGCSSPDLKTVLAATARRGLSGEGSTTCAENELFCWFGCMPLSEFNITSAETCTERKLSLQCMNPRGQVHEDGMDHGDYFPACTDRTYETHPVTPFPMIDQQDEEVCTLDLWTEFLEEDTSYDHMANLTMDGGAEAILFWSIVESEYVDDGKKIKARLAFNNVFGWLALGLANTTDYGLNGMLGANVLLAMPGETTPPPRGWT